ncbi:MAG: histone H1 [Casimicrobium sp.]
MPRKDLNTAAFAIMQQATGEVVPEPIDEKKKAAQESGRRGGLKGGVARTAALTPEQRADIARIAASARWKKGS